MIASWLLDTSRPASEAMATSASPKMGTAVPSAQADSERVMIPGVTGCSGGDLDRARATTGR